MLTRTAILRRPRFLGLFIITLAFGASGAPAETVPTLITEGKRIYAAKKCNVCHTIDAKGGKLGGDLSQVGAKRDSQWLLRFLANPKAVVPKAKMMPFRGSEEELEALVAYLRSLK